MQVTGITFVGTRTPAREQMADFARDVLGMRPREDPHQSSATFFDLPDGTSFAVSDTDGPDAAERTVGFLVDDVEAAAADLRAAGCVTDEVASSGRHRYVHFRAPDGQLYELVEELRQRG